MLSKKDKLVLKELDINPRRSNAQIAKKTGVNKETVNYTIKKLEKQGIIQSYFSLINYFSLDEKIFKLLLRYQNVGEKKESEITTWLNDRKEVVWIGKVEGKWDLIITIREEKIENIYELLEEFGTLFSKNIQEKQLLISYDLEWLSEKYLYEDKKEFYKINLNQKDEKIEIDSKDMIIIKLLEHNSRIPAVDIASKIKLTAEATAKRINNLIKKKLIMGFKLRINYEKLEKGYQHIFISLKDLSKLKEVVSYYENSKNCIFIMKYHGNYDLHVELVTDSEKESREIIKELREKFGEIISDYQKITVLEELKLF